MNNADNKFFVELGAVFNPQGFNEAEKKIEETNTAFEKSYDSLGKKSASTASQMSKALLNSAKLSAGAMDSFFNKSSKGFLDFEALAKKAFNNVLNSFLSMAGSMLSKSLMSGIGSMFGGGMLGGVLGSRETGGPIPKTGPYLLHGGEYVLPKSAVDNMSQGSTVAAANITVNTPVNIASVSNNVDVKYLASEIAEAARRGAAWAVEYAKVNYKVGKKREGEVCL